MGAMDRLALGDLSGAVRRVQLVPNPAAGANWRVAVPGDQVWRVLGIVGLFTTSAVAGTRVVELTVDDSTTTVVRIVPPSQQVASQGFTWSWVAGLGVGAAAIVGTVTAPLPENFVLGPGYRLGSAVFNLDAGDAWTSVVLWIEQQQTGVTDLGVARQAADELYDSPL